METILWAVKIGAADWEEEVITSTANKEHLEKAKAWALTNGFDRLRVSKWNGEKPDFVGAIGGINNGKRD